MTSIMVNGLTRGATTKITCPRTITLVKWRYMINIVNINGFVYRFISYIADVYHVKLYVQYKLPYRNGDGNEERAFRIQGISSSL